MPAQKGYRTRVGQFVKMVTPPRINRPGRNYVLRVLPQRKAMAAKLSAYETLGHLHKWTPSTGTATIQQVVAAQGALAGARNTLRSLGHSDAGVSIPYVHISNVALAAMFRDAMDVVYRAWYSEYLIALQVSGKPARTQIGREMPASLAVENLFFEGFAEASANGTILDPDAFVRKLQDAVWVLIASVHIRPALVTEHEVDSRTYERLRQSFLDNNPRIRGAGLLLDLASGLPEKLDATLGDPEALEDLWNQIDNAMDLTVEPRPEPFRG